MASVQTTKNHFPETTPVSTPGTAAVSSSLVSHLKVEHLALGLARDGLAGLAGLLQYFLGRAFNRGQERVPA